VVQYIIDNYLLYLASRFVTIVAYHFAESFQSVLLSATVLRFGNAVSVENYAITAIELRLSLRDKPSDIRFQTEGKTQIDRIYPLDPTVYSEY
jgi:hypothetical protein